MRAKSSGLAPERSSNNIGDLTEGGFERRETEAPIGFNKALARLALRQIDGDDLVDGFRHMLCRQSGAQKFAEREFFGGVAANGDLIRLLAFFLEAENADMGDVMMAAGVDAAGHFDIQLANVLLLRRIGEMARQVLRQRDRTGRRQRAIIKAGAAQYIGDEADIRRGQIE